MLDANLRDRIESWITNAAELIAREQQSIEYLRNSRDTGALPVADLLMQKSQQIVGTLISVQKLLEQVVAERVANE